MRYRALDAWRGVAALVIAASRLYVDSALWHSPLVRFSWPLVDFFFVLSGFVIAHAYLHRLDAPGAAGGFVLRRVGRLWPLHLFTLGVLVALEAAKWLMVARGIPSDTVPFTGDQAPAQLWPNLFLVQALGPFPASWNTPSWSISVEFWTYLVFLAVVLTARSRLVLASVALVAVSLAVLSQAPRGMESTFDFGLFRCLAGFFAGVVVHRVHEALRGRLPGAFPAWSAAEAGAVLLVAAFLVVTPRTPLAYAAPAVMSLAVFVFAQERGALSRALSGRVGAALGRWSYSIYLVCPIVAIVIERAASLAERRLGRAIWGPGPEGVERLMSLGPWANELVLAGYLALVLAASALTYRFVEAPARAWFNARAARLEARRAPRLAPAE
jgi:peptidoglycan/LPS O-acetylase OafA/YrhL